MSEESEKPGTFIEKTKRFFREFGAILSRRFPWVMFSISVLFLSLVAALLVVWVYIPVSTELKEVELSEVQLVEQQRLQEQAFVFGDYCLALLLMVWPIFWIEQIFAYLASKQSARLGWKGEVFQLLIFICPPLRLAAPNRFMDRQIWIPTIGWEEPSKVLSARLERFFSTPMLVIALLILPILLVEMLLGSLVESNFWLRLTLHVCTGLIWIAFSIEFIIMVSATDKRLDYVKKNWIDLAIVLLPLVSFLRSLRIFRALRLAKYAKAKQLAKLGRAYRLRGLYTKVIRALLVFEIFGRLFRLSPEKKLETLISLKAEKEEELAELNSAIQELESEIEKANMSNADSPDIEPT